MLRHVMALVMVCLAGGTPGAAEQPQPSTADSVGPQVVDGWTAASPRDEIRPSFDHQPGAGRDGQTALIIQSDHRQGLDGYWVKSFPVTGGAYCRFEAFRKASQVQSTRRRRWFASCGWTIRAGALTTTAHW